MITQLKVKQIIDLGLWRQVCEYKEWDEWILNEGKISEDEVVTFDSTFKKRNKVEDLKIESVNKALRVVHHEDSERAQFLLSEYGEVTSITMNKKELEQLILHLELIKQEMS